MTLQARPTTYNGVAMRSTLEAGFAAWLDRRCFVWEYEPRRFYTADAHYLPDFVVHGHCRANFGWNCGDPDDGGRHSPTDWADLYVEVRPVADGDEALRLAQIIWASEPTAHLLYASPDQPWHYEFGMVLCDGYDGAGGHLEDGMVFDCGFCGGTNVMASWGDWSCQRCGDGDGDHHLRPLLDAPWSDQSWLNL